MGKSRWISLGLAFVVALAIGALEWDRAHYFLTPRIAASPSENSSAPNSSLLGFKLGRLMQNMEWAAYDARFRLSGTHKPNPNIVIVAVDEKSLQALHQWPWPRSIHAQLINTLKAAPPKALLFDILFMDPFTSDPDGDQDLVRATQEHPWVIHSFFLTVDNDRITGGHMPFETLAAVGPTVGSVNAFADDDGVLRGALLSMRLDRLQIPLLSLVGASRYLGRTPQDILRTLPLNDRGEMGVRYTGPAYTYPYIPYSDVLAGKVSPALFANKIVLVGSSATGTYDHYPTPLASSMPGVEFHANVIDNIISASALRSAPMSITYLGIMLMALLCGLILARVPARAGLAWALGAMVLYGGTSEWLFTQRQFVIDVAGPLLTLTVGYLAILVYRFFTEEREKRLVRSFFSQQVSGELLDVLMNDPSVLRRAGERREMTVFFSDIAGFTSISERLQPEELVELLNEYLTSMTDVVFQQGGYIDKYMGDGVMAFWNGILRQTDHAERACRCALESMKQLGALNKALVERGLIPLSARIGINTGAMAAGYMGSAQKKQYTVMGDNVNLGSRLEGANKAFGTSIMISEFTYEVVQHQFEVRFLDRIRVPGKAKPVKTYELLAEKGALDPQWIKAIPIYHDGIQLFADHQFAQARSRFVQVLAIIGKDKASESYLERATAFIERPPAKEWDGIFELKVK